MGPADLNGRRNGNGLKPVTKTIAAGVIVLFLGGVSTYIWNLHKEVAGLRSDVAKSYVLLGVHKTDLGRLNKFMIEGRRFTLERGENLEDDVEALTEDHKALRLVVSEDKLVLARMPHQMIFPFSDAWQRRVSDLENKLAVLKGRVENLHRKLKNGD